MAAMRAVLAVLAAAALAACGDNIVPVDVSSGRLTARIWADPPQIQLLVDGRVAWQTERGGGPHAAKAPPYGFAAVGTLAVTVDEQFGSYKLTEDASAEHWQRTSSRRPRARRSSSTAAAGRSAPVR